jgi:hypothetical protein
MTGVPNNYKLIFNNPHDINTDLHKAATEGWRPILMSTEPTAAGLTVVYVILENSPSAFRT